MSPRTGRPASWRRSRWPLAIPALVLLAVLLGLGAIFSVTDPWRDEYASFRSIKPGMTEEDVIRLLGTPARMYERATAPIDYYEPGYSHPERHITNKVLIYIGAEPIAYVYIDHTGRVEEVFVGGS